MGQLLIRNLENSVIESYRLRARAAGTSLEQYVRELLTKQAPMTPAERLAFTQNIRAQTVGPSTPMTKDEIREGLE